MPKKTVSKKSDPMMLQIMIIVALAAIALFLFTLKSTLPVTKKTTEVTPAEFNGTSQQLDNVNINQIDTGLKQLNIETSTF